MKQNELLILIISCFVISVVWIISNLIHAQATSTFTETQNIQILPIEPHFNAGIVTMLKERTTVEPLFESTKVSSTSPLLTSPSPLPAISAPKTSSSSGTNTVSP